MLLANLFLLVWDYDRLKHVLPFKRTEEAQYVVNKTSKFPGWFFGFVFGVLVFVVVINVFMYDIRPGNSDIECANGCKNNGSPGACQQFCDCIYKAANPLNTCLTEYKKAK
jgi:hypothetical protein